MRHALFDTAEADLTRWLRGEVALEAPSDGTPFTYILGQSLSLDQQSLVQVVMTPHCHYISSETMHGRWKHENSLAK